MLNIYCRLSFKHKQIVLISNILDNFSHTRLPSTNTILSEHEDNIREPRSDSKRSALEISITDILINWLLNNVYKIYYMKTHGLVGFDSPLEALKKFSYTHYVDTV